MYDPPDYVLRGSFRKLYGDITAIRRPELLRRLRMTPEFSYYADQMIERGLSRSILRVAQDPPTSRSEEPAGPADEWLEFDHDGPNSFDDQFRGIFDRT